MPQHMITAVEATAIAAAYKRTLTDILTCINTGIEIQAGGGGHCYTMPADRIPKEWYGTIQDELFKRGFAIDHQQGYMLISWP